MKMATPLAKGEYVVAQVAELPPGTSKIVRVRNLEIGVFNVSGEYHALLNNCPHQNGPVCAGPVGGEMICNASTDWRFQWRRAGEILICPWHGSEFDLLTGQCLTMKNQRLRRFPVRVVDDEIRLDTSNARIRAEVVDVEAEGAR
jgi:nitrite reductase/ring-hydroxylating ferredoxin subunit